MNTKELNRAKQEFQEIQKKPLKERNGELKRFMNQYHIHQPNVSRTSIQSIDEWRDACVSSIHTFLQTEMMLNACVSARESAESAKESCRLAKWSCFCAAVAAIAACIGLLLTLRFK